MTDNDIDAIRRTPLAAEPGNNTFVVWYDPNNEPYAVYFRSDTNAWDDDQRWFNADQAGGDLDGPYSWDNLREELRGNDGPHLLVPAAKVDELTADLAQSREQAATYANEIGTLKAENARLRQQRDETKAGIQRLIAFRNAKVYEVDELATRLRTVRALAEGPHGEGDFGSIPARDLLNAIGEEHPAESRPVVVLDSTDKAEVAR